MPATQGNFSIVLDTVADGVTVQSRTGHLVYANLAAARVLGFSSRDELVATPPADVLARFELLDEDGQLLDLATLPGRRVLEGEPEAAVIMRVRALPAGEERWSSVRATPMIDAGGDVAFAVNIWHDITEQKRTEHRQRFLVRAGELLASSLDVEATLATIADLAVPELADWCAVHLVRSDGSLAQLAVAHADPDRTEWARHLQERYPSDPDAAHGVANVIRTGRAELIPEVTDAMLVAAARDADHLEIARRVGLRSAIIVPLAGRDRMLGAISFVAAESGRRYGASELELLEDLARRAAVAIDNAHLYDAERAARARADEAHLRFRALFEGIPDAILVLDDDDSIIDVNAGACALLGYDAEELILLPIADLIPDAAKADVGAMLDEWRGAMEVRRGDGALVPVDLWFRRLDLPSGPVRIGALRDISARRAADRAREEVLAAVSHDLRNPISVIKAHVQLLLRGLERGQAPDAAQLRERLTAIDAMGTRMASLLEDMADVARSQRGETIEVSRKPTDLVDLARRSAGEMASAASREVRVESGLDTLVGMWDQRGLERVIHNLMLNALKYSPEGGIVVVRVDRGEDAGGAWAELAVLDEGIGIPESDLPRIFDPWYRGSNVGHIAGTGIGLAGARNLVEAQGGAIAVARRVPRGTAVTVRLPLHRPDAPDGAAAVALEVPPELLTATQETPAPPG